VPLTTWTPPALASETRPYRRDLWRVVESQSVASTMRLANSLEEQAVLETILEESKPPLPVATEKLHYLLATPFRYRPQIGSRFRAPFDAGVWYGAEELRTALAEKSYWRLRFLLDSPGMPELDPVPHTVFAAAISAVCVDLTMAPLVRDRAIWTDRKSYEQTQGFAAVVRDAAVQAIRYESVRDPEHAACAAVLTPAAFARRRPQRQEAWFIATSRARVRCARDLPGVTAWEFTREQLL
jgi:hypothetical protein